MICSRTHAHTITETGRSIQRTTTIAATTNAAASALHCHAVSGNRAAVAGEYYSAGRRPLPELVK